MLFTFIPLFVIGSTFALDSNLLRSYDSKICKNEPSCHLVDQQNLPKSRRTLEGRDCMCDFECVEYNDCCRDSEFYGANTASGASYYCSPNGKVYMVTTCPPGYANQEVISRCLASTEPLNGDDSSVIRPATNLKRRITYGNAYCAQCNNDIDDIVLWNVTAGCGEAPPGYVSATTQIPETTENNVLENSYNTPEENELTTPPKNVYSSSKNTNKNFATPTKGLNLRVPIPINTNSETIFSGPIKIPSLGSFNLQLTRQKRASNIDFSKHAKDLDKILKNVRYDPNSKNFVSQFQGKNFICEYSSQIPKNFELYVRKCVPNLISSCPVSAGQEIADKCHSYTAIVYEKTTKNAFRNKDCAKCNGASEISLTGCPQGERAAASSLFSTSDKGSGAPCNTPELKAKFCR